MTKLELQNQIKKIERQISKLYKEHRSWVASDSYNDNEEYQWYVKNIRPLSKEQDALKEELHKIEQLEIKVGDGITISCWTDCEAYTVISRTAKTITIQRDKAIRTDKNGMSDCQEYRYERDKNGGIRTMRWSDKLGCWKDGNYHGYTGRHEYYDYSF